MRDEFKSETEEKGKTVGALCTLAFVLAVGAATIHFGGQAVEGLCQQAERELRAMNTMMAPR